MGFQGRQYNKLNRRDYLNPFYEQRLAVDQFRADVLIRSLESTYQRNGPLVLNVAKCKPENTDRLDSVLEHINSHAHLVEGLRVFCSGRQEDSSFLDYLATRTLALRSLHVNFDMKSGTVEQIDTVEKALALAERWDVAGLGISLKTLHDDALAHLWSSLATLVACKPNVHTLSVTTMLEVCPWGLALVLRGNSSLRRLSIKHAGHVAVRLINPRELASDLCSAIESMTGLREFVESYFVHSVSQRLVSAALRSERIQLVSHCDVPLDIHQYINYHRVDDSTDASVEEVVGSLQQAPAGLSYISFPFVLTKRDHIEFLLGFIVSRNAVLRGLSFRVDLNRDEFDGTTTTGYGNKIASALSECPCLSELCISSSRPEIVTHFMSPPPNLLHISLETGRVSLRELLSCGYLRSVTVSWTFTKDEANEIRELMNECKSIESFSTGDRPGFRPDVSDVEERNARQHFVQTMACFVAWISQFTGEFLFSPDVVVVVLSAADNYYRVS